MSPVEDRNWWKWRRDELTWAICIINPAGTEYEISESRLAQLDRDVATLLNDMLEGLIDIQNENEALRARDALRDKAEGQVAFDVVAQLEAAKAERAADKAGFEAVIRELRGEVAALKADRAEREKQEPVAWCTSSPTPNVPGQLKIPLYAAPPVIVRIDPETGRTKE